MVVDEQRIRLIIGPSSVHRVPLPETRHHALSFNPICRRPGLLAPSPPPSAQVDGHLCAREARKHRAQVAPHDGPPFFPFFRPRRVLLSRARGNCVSGFACFSDLRTCCEGTTGDASSADKEFRGDASAVIGRFRVFASSDDAAGSGLVRESNIKLMMSRQHTKTFVGCCKVSRHNRAVEAADVERKGSRFELAAAVFWSFKSSSRRTKMAPDLRILADVSGGSVPSTPAPEIGQWWRRRRRRPPFVFDGAHAPQLTAASRAARRGGIRPPPAPDRRNAGQTRAPGSPRSMATAGVDLAAAPARGRCEAFY